MNKVNSTLVRHLRELSHVCALDVADDFSFFIIHGIRVQAGYTINETPVTTLSALIEVPENYPVEPPGVGDNRIYLPKGLRYKGKKIEHYHSFGTREKKWVWYCWHEIDWDPRRDDLITILELLRTHLYDPFGRK